MASYPPLGTPVGPTPGLVQRGNIPLSVRPRVPVNGGTGTIYSMGVGFDEGEHLIPRISQAGVLMTPEGAIEEFLRTGQHLGIFETPAASTAYGQRLSAAQAARPPLTPEQARQRGVLEALMKHGP